MRTSTASEGRDYFRELGVRPFINAAGTYTALTASLMLPEVLEAMKYASNYFVSLEELQVRVGERIAQSLNCEAAMVTAGAASALTLGTAGVLTGKDGERIAQLPNLKGMKNQVIVQRAHRFEFDHAVRSCGVKLVQIDTRTELEDSINEETALLLFINYQCGKGQIGDAEFVEIGTRRGIPTFIDCAADVPPVENLFKYSRMGFDLVAFSGGKGIRGPQSTGLLLGRKDLIESAWLNSSPNSDSIGRGMKVSKESILGMLVALELYLDRDHSQEWSEWENRANLIIKAARQITGVDAKVYVPEIANHSPHVRLAWNPLELGQTPAEAEDALRAGDPSIEVKCDGQALHVSVWMMQPGEERVVARRLQEVLSPA